MEADAERASCGVVSDLVGRTVGATNPSRSNRTSSDEVAAAGSPTDDVRESASGGWRAGCELRAGGGLVVRRDIGLSDDDDWDSSTSTGPAS